jgi:hypothetical protein
VHSVSIYDKSGEVVQVLEFDEPLTHVSGRVSKSKLGIYYKGVGVPYRSQLSLDPNLYPVIKQDEVFYCGYNVTNPNYIGKTGIFQERYQPYFSDFIGSCGIKELNIIRNSREFKRSSVEVLDCINYDEANKQFYFIMDYKCNRKGYLWGGQPKDLYELLEYMVTEGWNFPWDKTSIKDITRGGLVSDVADLFRSKELVHQIGTVYSVIYSLFKIYQRSFNEFSEYVGSNTISDRHIPTLIIFLLEKFGVDTEEVFRNSEEQYFYNHLIGDYLIQGRNCAYVEDFNYGDTVKAQYIEKFSQKLGV